MGEIADMMLDGTLCEQCGGFVNEVPPGHPVLCGDCAPAREKTLRPKQAPPKPKVPKVKCPKCNKHLRGEQGLADHMKASHG